MKNFLILFFALFGFESLASSQFNALSLLDAAREGDTNEIKRLITEKGLDPNETRGLRGGNTVLHKSYDGDGYHFRGIDFETIQTLVKLGANINAKNSRGETPLHTASVYGSDFSVQRLLRAGANVHAIDNNGDKALHSVCRAMEKAGRASYRYEKNIKTLIGQGGISINARAKHGKTCLHIVSVSSKRIRSIKFLVRMGAFVNVQENTVGFTPLHILASRRNKSAIKYLLNNGANPNIKEKNGHPPFDYTPDPDIRRILGDPTFL